MYDWLKTMVEWVSEWVSEQVDVSSSAWLKDPNYYQYKCMLIYCMFVFNFFFFFFLFSFFFSHLILSADSEYVTHQLDSFKKVHISRKIITPKKFIVQELCESRGGRPGLSVLTSLLVSVDVKIYCTVLRHWSQLVPNMSHDIWGH